MTAFASDRRSPAAFAIGLVAFPFIRVQSSLNLPMDLPESERYANAGGRPQRFLAVAFPPLRPAALCCAVVPPCFDEPPDPDFLPPRFDAPGEFAILAARSFDIPFFFSASYCSGFFTLARVD